MSDPRYPIGKFTFDGPPDQNAAKEIYRRHRTDSGGVACRGPGSLAAADRNSLSRWRMDRAASYPSCSRKPHERLHPLQTGADRRRADHQAVHGRSLGQIARCRIHSAGSFAEPCSTHCTTVGCICCAPSNRKTGSGPSIIPSSGIDAAGKEPGLVFLAWQASRSPHHGVEEEDGMVRSITGLAREIHTLA